MPRSDTQSLLESTTLDLGAKAFAPGSNQLTREVVRGLLEPRPGPCLSIFLPTVRVGAETLQNPIRFKNLLRSAEGALLERGVEKNDVELLLEPLRELLADHEFWQHQIAGLVVFRAPDLLRAYRLPLPLPELAVVEDHFRLKPLLPLFDGDGRFYVLALSMNQVRLFEGTRWSIHEVDLGNRVPRSLVAAVGEKLGQKPLHFSNSGPGARVRVGGPAFHTHGVTEDDTKASLDVFFHRVDSGLQELPLDRNAPLVLAGVDYLLPLYRAASEHPNVLAEGILGNPDEQRPEELHAAAWRLVEPLFLAPRRRAAERYRELSRTGLATSRLEDVVPAAHDGRVESLFTALGVRCWGSWDAENHVARRHDEQTAASEDLLDLAAVQSFLHGAEVFAVPPEEMPEAGQPVAAIFRW